MFKETILLINENLGELQLVKELMLLELSEVSIFDSDRSIVIEIGFFKLFIESKSSVCTCMGAAAFDKCAILIETFIAASELLGSVELLCVKSAQVGIGLVLLSELLEVLLSI